MSDSALLLRLNNHPHEFRDYMTIFQACLYVKKYIPRFCYHMALKIAGNCRMCLVEEKSSLKPLASCAITISNGMGIQTETEMIKKAREGVLEYLLINHPLDCPICDQGGECDSQDQTMVFGADRGRFYENKRSTPNKNLGYLIKTFLNRCIHCARRTRFLADLTGTADLQLLGRGLKTEIGTYTDKFITSEVSGNIADLCPVGALTSKPYAFRARPWELVPAYSFDIMDALGANIEVNYRGTEIMRILPRINKAINGEWITDKTRFFYDAIMLQRLSEPYIAAGNEFSTVGWLSTFEFAKNSLFVYTDHEEIDVLSFSFGSFLDLETGFSLKNFFSRYGFNFSSRDFGGAFSIENDYRSSYIFNIEQLEPDFLKSRNIIIANLNIRYESPLLNLQIRASQQEEEFNVFLLGFLANTNFNFTHFGPIAAKSSILKFFEKKADAVVILGGQGPTRQYLSSPVEQTNYVWTKISQLSYLELFVPTKVWLPKAVVGINVGLFLPELPVSSVTMGTSLNFVHHMIDDYFTFSSTAIFWPTKFYLEKVSSFVGNVGHFFSTVINIFGFNIRGTKEEHRIINAIHDILGSSSENMSFEVINFAKLGINEKAISLRTNYTMPTTLTVQNALSRSLINNYYTTNELCLTSPVLGLCAKKYGVLNDFLWVFPAINKC